ncbi:MAG TPA: diguanylate cyclase, partial [Noviherbaspirillum sp.]|nr:diguanylate cyclase [Noviherbaspirillum sp.]
MDSAVHKLPAKSALVVDDGPVERMAGKSMLEKLGFSVITAASGEEALRLLEDQPADLVLCDISMPGIGGMGLLEATRGRPQPPLFIMSTSHNDAEHAVASLRNGAYGYLTKPLRFDTLRATVADAIAKYEEQKSASVNEMALAHHDTLTGLMNKAGFSKLLTDRLRDMPEGASAGALLLLKIVGLNHINHSYGRNEGNKALQLSARILSRLVRSSDLLARFGGDMFAIHFNAVEHGQVEQRILNVAETVESTKMPLAGEVLTLTVVAGGACAYGMMEMEDLLNRADFALHLARDRSRNRIHLYSEADDVHKRELSHQLNTVAVVRAALRDTQRIAMHYQPIINLDTGTISHYEALLRLMDDNGTPCNTGELVKTCEVFGLIGELDRAVVKATLRDVARVPANAG